MSYYRRGGYSRRPSYRTNAVTTTSYDAWCSEAQHKAIKAIFDDLRAATPHATPEMLAVRAALLVGNVKDTLIKVLSDNLVGDTQEPVYRTVTKEQVRPVFDAMNTLKTVFAPAIAAIKASKYPYLPPHDFLMVSKINGTCCRCHRATVAGTDIAIKVQGKFQGWCLTCATTDPAEADAAEAAAKAALAALAGLHLFDRKVYRISDDGTVEVRRGRRWYEVKGDAAPFSDATRVTAEIASAYADEFGQCCNCGESIGEGESRRSIAVGYGPVCAKRWGWYYPTDAEAEDIIARRRLAKLASL